MKLLIKVIFFSSLLFTSFSAKAYFFSFYLSGAEGNAESFDSTLDVCVSTTANVGDETTSPNGNKAKIVSIDGPSQECANTTPAESIRAKKTFHFLPSEKAGLTIPDEFIQKSISNADRLSGVVLDARGSDSRRFLLVRIYHDKNAKDFMGYMEQKFSKGESFVNGNIVQRQEYNLNGMKGYKSEINTTYSSYNTKEKDEDITVLITAYVFKNKLIYIHIGAPRNQFQLLRPLYTQIPLSLTGLRGDGPISSSKSSPAIDQFKQQCKDLGFKPGTEKFGNCVLELNK
jgi:hypothetical protein